MTTESHHERVVLPIGDGTLRLVAAGLAFLVATIHLHWGLPRFVAYLLAGTMPDPLPPIFVVTSVAILVGVSLVAAGADRRPIYLVGIALMLAYLLGYVVWHTALAHGAFWPGRIAHAHSEGPATIVVSHLLDAPIELVSKAAELVLLALLVVLYRREY